MGRAGSSRRASPVEAAVRAEGFPDFQFTERSAPDQLRRASDRPEHSPVVLYVEPYASNKLAASASTSPRAFRGRFAERNRNRRAQRLRAAPAARQRTHRQLVGLYHAAARLQSIGRLIGASPAARGASLPGYILGIFRLRDLLETMFRRMGGLGVEVLFIDTTVPT